MKSNTYGYVTIAKQRCDFFAENWEEIDWLLPSTCTTSILYDSLFDILSLLTNTSSLFNIDLASINSIA